MDLHPNGLSFGCLLEVGFFGTSSPDFNKQHLRAHPAPSSATFSLTGFHCKGGTGANKFFPCQEVDFVKHELLGFGAFLTRPLSIHFLCAASNRCALVLWNL